MVLARTGVAIQARSRSIAQPILVGAALLASWVFPPAVASNAFIAYVGTYTKGQSRGIYAYRYDAGSGELTPLGLAAATSNPSFLAADPKGRYLYAVNESGEYRNPPSGAVSAFAIDASNGKLTLVNRVPSHGAAPCYLSLDKSGRFVLVANFDGGSVAVFPVLRDGSLGERTGFVQHGDSTPRRRATREPHAHWIEVTADNRYAIAADLGLDELLVYRFNASQGTLTPSTPRLAALERGTGPRHVAFHPNGVFAYVVNEGNSTVTSFSYETSTGTLTPFQSITTLPTEFKGENATAEIAVHPRGKFVYASNRGHDSIAVFAVSPKDGKLALLENVPTGGRSPRSFELDPTGTRLLVANEESGDIIVFQIDAATGHLTQAGKALKVPFPVCIKFIALRQSSYQQAQ